MKTKLFPLLISFLFSGLVYGQNANSGQPEPHNHLKAGVMGSNPQRVEEFSWNDSWVPFAIEDLKYDINGRLLEEQRIEGNQKTRTLYSYGDMEFPTESILQIWQDGVWVNVERSRDLFDGENYLGWTEESWTDGEWVLDQGARYTYTMDGNHVAVMVIEVKSSGQDWVNMQRYTYTYEGNDTRPAVSVVEVWDNGVWNLDFKIDHTYIDAHHWEEINSSYMDGGWMVAAKTAYEEDEYGSLTMTMYSPVGNDWMAMSRTKYINDTHGNQILFTIEFYSTDWTVYSGTQYLLTYDGNNLVQRITQNMSTEPGGPVKSEPTWTNVFKEVFSLFHVAGTNNILSQELQVTLYPNPVNNMLNIRFMNATNSSKVSLHIYSLTGQTVMQEEVNIHPGIQNIRIPVSEIREGAYIVQVRSINGGIISNQKIQIQ